MPLNAAGLIVLFRSDMSDPEMPGGGDDSDSLWLDSEITEWMGEAQNELCAYTDILFDRKTYKVTATADEGLYALSEKITKVRRGVGADGRKLTALSIAELNRQYQPGDWDYNTAGDGIINYEWESLVGIPKYIVTDFETGQVRLVPVPATGATNEDIQLDVYKLPDDPVVLEVPDKYRRKLLHKIKAFAYRKDDIDTQDLNRAILEEERWDTALEQIDRQFKRLNRGVQVVSYGGI